MARFAVAIFDLDGTLTDSEPGITEAVRRALVATGYPIPGTDGLRRHIGPPLEWGFREIDGMDAADAVRARDAFRAYYRERGWAENEVYPGVREMLGELRQAGVAMAIATAKLEELAHRICDHFGLTEQVAGVFGPGPDDSSPAKREQLERALTAAGWGGDAASAVMIGDRHHDIEAAASLGIASIAAGWGYGTSEERAAATYQAATPSDVTAIVLGH